MWSPHRARKVEDDNLLHPFVPFTTFGDPKTLNCDRDSQGDVWFADMGVYYFVIVSGDLDAAQSTLDSGAQMIIIPSEYSGEELKDLFFFAPDESKSSPTTINGQEAAKVEFTENKQLKIELVVVRENWALVVLATFPSEKEMEYRPLIEEIINTIEIK